MERLRKHKHKKMKTKTQAVAVEPVCMVHWSVVIKDKRRFLEAWFPEPHDLSNIDVRGAARLGTSFSRRYHRQFHGVSIEVAHWGWSRDLNAFAVKSPKGHVYWARMEHRADSKSEQTWRCIMSVLKGVKQRVPIDQFGQPPTTDVHPLPGDAAPMPSPLPSPSPSPSPPQLPPMLLKMAAEILTKLFQTE